MPALPATHQSPSPATAVVIHEKRLGHFIDEMGQLDLERNLRDQTISDCLVSLPQGQSIAFDSYEEMCRVNYEEFYGYLQKSIQDTVSGMGGISETAVSEFVSLPSKYQKQESWKLYGWCRQNLSELHFKGILEFFFAPERKEITPPSGENLVSLMRDGTEEFCQLLVPDGKLREQKRKEDVMQMIGSLKEQGLTQAKIANRLNKMGVKTQNMQGRWTQSKVSSLVARKH